MMTKDIVYNMQRWCLSFCLIASCSTSMIMAQENKGAQRIHKAIVEFVNKYQDPIYQYAVTSITAPEDELPPNKQHKVKYTKRNHFSENERLFGTLEKTQYMQVWVFDIYSGQVEPEDPFPLKNILKAFDKGVSHCSSCYSYTVGQGQSVFPGVIIEYGPNGGNKHDHAFSNKDNVRLISFTDEDGFRSTYTLTWQIELDNDEAKSVDYKKLFKKDSNKQYVHLSGTIGWHHCPASAHPIRPWELDDEDRDYFFKSSGNAKHTSLGEKPVIMPTNEVQLNNLEIEEGSYVAYKTLLAKVKRMEQLVMNSNAHEKLAISYTLDKVCNEYTALLSPWQYDELKRHISEIKKKLEENPEENLTTNAENILKEKINRTPDMASLSDRDQAYLNACGFHLLRHDVCHDHVTYDGQYYTGDEIVKYLDTYDSESEQKYHAEKVVKNLEPGIYRLSVAVRASGLGAFIYALGDHDTKYLEEIPPYYTEGGNIWADACKRIEQLKAEGRDDEITGYDRRLARANDGKGFGWTRLVIDNIIVKDGVVKFGVSTLPEFTGKTLRATWFSACDFELTKVSTFK